MELVHNSTLIWAVIRPNGPLTWASIRLTIFVGLSSAQWTCIMGPISPNFPGPSLMTYGLGWLQIRPNEIRLNGPLTWAG